MLRVEVERLSGEDFDLSLLGLTDDDMKALTENHEEGQGFGAGGGPAAFPEKDEDLETDYKCPKCGYEWSGNPK